MKNYYFDWYDGFGSSLFAENKASEEEYELRENGETTGNADGAADEERPFIAPILGKPLEHAVQEYRKELMKFQDWGGPKQQEFFRSYDLDNEIAILLGTCTPRIAKLLLDCLAYVMSWMDPSGAFAYPVFLSDCQAVRFRHVCYEPSWCERAKCITTETLVKDKESFDLFYSYALLTINALDDKDRACLFKHFSDFAEEGDIMTENDFEEARDAFESSHRPQPDTLDADAANFYKSLDPKLDTMTRLMMKEAYVYESYNHLDDWKTDGEEQDENFTRFAQECGVMPWELLPLKDEYRSRPFEEWDMKPIFPVIDYDPDPEPWQSVRFLNYGYRDMEVFCDEPAGLKYPEGDDAYTERLLKGMIAGRKSWRKSQYAAYEKEQLKNWEYFKEHADEDQEFMAEFGAAVLKNHGDLSKVGNEKPAFELLMMSQEDFLKELRDFIRHNPDYYEHNGEEIFDELCYSTDVSEIQDWNKQVFQHILKNWDKTAFFI